MDSTCITQEQGTVFFGLLSGSEQWINDTVWAGKNEESKIYTLPITFPQYSVFGIMGDTSGNLDVQVVPYKSNEGACILSKTNNTVTVNCGWTDGISSSVNVLLIGK